jgi:hypothetical protein
VDHLATLQTRAAALSVCMAWVMTAMLCQTAVVQALVGQVLAWSAVVLWAVLVLN